MDVPLSARDGAYRVDDVGVGRLLEHVAARTGLERLAHVVRVVLHREDEHRASGTAWSSAGIPSMPLLPGMTTSISTTSGLCSSASKTARSAFAASPDRLDVLLGVENAAEPGADDGVVVDDEHPDGLRRAALRVTEAVPRPRSSCRCPGSSRASSCPPTSATRSRIPLRPRPRRRARRRRSRRRRPRRRPRAAFSFRVSRMLTLVAPACFAMFVSASCTIRYIVVSTSAGSRSSPSRISRSIASSDVS